MNLQEPFRTHQIDFNKIVYTKIKTSDIKKIIYIKYNDNKIHKPLVIQVPSILNLNQPIKINEEYYELEIPLITQDKSKSNNLIDFFENLDKKIIQDAKDNSKIWLEGFSANNSIKYKKIIRESDLYKEGIIKIKIIKNNDFETLLQVDNKKRITIKEIPSNSWCKMLIEIYALVINSQTNTFSIFARPIILSFKDKQVSNYNYTFLDDSDSDKEENDIPDTELNSIFLKTLSSNKKEDMLTSSQIKVIGENNNGILTTSSSEYSSTSSSEKKNKSKLESAQLESELLESAKLESVKLESALLESAKLESALLESAKLESELLEDEKLNKKSGDKMVDNKIYEKSVSYETSSDEINLDDSSDDKELHKLLSQKRTNQ